jgi:hypothetical protein
MQPPCALCSTLLPILDKCKEKNFYLSDDFKKNFYLDSSLDLIEAIDLQKDDICMFVSFVSNWPQT